MAKHKFQTEVNQLLQLIIHSLYSNKEIFLRELISNASDALDKFKYLTLTNKKFSSQSFQPRVDISFKKSESGSRIIISDNGIGMSKNDLKENLGTIARSGTKNFLGKLSGDMKKDSNLIGQFGVGFYSCFMVADTVEVLTKKAGEKTAFLWKSDGKTGFTIKDSSRESNGTSITLNINEEGKEFLSRWQLENIVKKYSDHISFPIFLEFEESIPSEDKDKDDVVEIKVEQINSASAFWKKSKSSLKKKDYNEFYKSFSNDSDDPMFYAHTQAEGTLDYTTLFFIPKKAPFDLYYPEFKAGIKLYIKRVFITEDDKELMPTYLRFVRGIIDSEDLPLNVSREILQQNKVLSKIKSNSIKKILGEIKNLSKNDKKYMEFYKEFGRPIKEGLYQDFENRDTLLELIRFKTTRNDGMVSFSKYVKGMKKDQKFIYFITGNDKSLINSPLLEVYNKQGIEVCIFDDEIDDIVFSAIPQYKDFKLKSVNHSDSVEDIKADKETSDKKRPKKVDQMLDNIKKILKDSVKDVVVSSRLTDSPCCLVADQNDPTAKMQEIMKAMGQGSSDKIKPIMEINLNHSLIKKLSKLNKGKAFSNIVYLLYDQSLMLEGMKVEDPYAFAGRLNEMLSKSL